MEREKEMEILGEEAIQRMSNEQLTSFLRGVFREIRGGSYLQFDPLHKVENRGQFVHPPLDEDDEKGELDAVFFDLSVNHYDYLKWIDSDKKIFNALVFNFENEMQELLKTRYEILMDNYFFHSRYDIFFCFISPKLSEEDKENHLPLFEAYMRGQIAAHNYLSNGRFIDREIMRGIRKLDENEIRLDSRTLLLRHRIVSSMNSVQHSFFSDTFGVKLGFTTVKKANSYMASFYATAPFRYLPKLLHDVISREREIDLFNFLLTKLRIPNYEEEIRKLTEQVYWLSDFKKIELRSGIGSRTTINEEVGFEFFISQHYEDNVRKFLAKEDACLFPELTPPDYYKNRRPTQPFDLIQDCIEYIESLKKANPERQPLGLIINYLLTRTLSTSLNPSILRDVNICLGESWTLTAESNFTLIMPIHLQHSHVPERFFYLCMVMTLEIMTVVNIVFGLQSIHHCPVSVLPETDRFQLFFRLVRRAICLFIIEQRKTKSNILVRWSQYHYSFSKLSYSDFGSEVKLEGGMDLQIFVSFVLKKVIRPLISLNSISSECHPYPDKPINMFWPQGLHVDFFLPFLLKEYFEKDSSNVERFDFNENCFYDIALMRLKLINEFWNFENWFDHRGPLHWHLFAVTAQLSQRQN